MQLRYSGTVRTMIAAIAASLIGANAPILANPHATISPIEQTLQDAAADYRADTPHELPDSNFFNPGDFVTNTCVPGRGMIQLGRWGLGGLPIPAYRERERWDLGAEGWVSYGPGEGRPAWVILRSFLAYNRLEDGMTAVAELKPIARASNGWFINFPLRIASTPGREGFQIAARVSKSWGEGFEWINGTIMFLSEDYLDRRDFGTSIWDNGAHDWIGLNVNGRGLNGAIPHAIGYHLTSRVSSIRLGSDFDYWKTTVSLDWAKPRWRVWINGGTTNGDPPVQDALDISIDAGIIGLPNWRVLAGKFLALGIEGRTPILSDIYIGGFASAATVSGNHNRVVEFGPSLTIAYEDLGYPAEFADWFIRFDLPIYSSGGLRYSTREDWDFRRFMIRVNFPILDLGREDIIRYRYPNR